MVYHNEPILRDGRIVGTVTSGNYGHHLGGSVAMGYVPCPGESAADLLASRFEIDVAGRRVPATASLKPLYDPTAARMRL
jgi:glycine cleavage system aminomethyltransferase T